MATYAAYRHVELDRVGLGKKRVLKPPGGGSSIVFDEDDTKHVKTRHQAQPQPEPESEAPQQVEKQQEQPQQEQPPPQQQEATSPKPDTNGMATPDCDKGDAAATRESNSTNGTPVNGVPAVNGQPTINGTSATNGTVSSGSTSSMSSAGNVTPNSAKHLNTQSRLFGEDPNQQTPSRRIRDHHRSNIFAAENTGDKPAFNGTPRPAGGNSAPRPSDNTPEVKTPEQPQPQVKQRQRVPPGGFSTQLW